MKNNLKNIAIIGNGDFAHNLKSYFDQIPSFKFIGFISKYSDHKNEFGEDSIHLLKKYNCDSLFNGIGNLGQKNYPEIFDPFLKGNFKFPNFYHKSSIVNNDSDISIGTIILENAVVKHSSKIGKFCLINSLSIVSHHCTVGDFTHISLGSKMGGNCNIGKNCFIGMNASIIENISIGDNVIVGAGSVVINDIPDNCIATGNPAIFKRRK